MIACVTTGRNNICSALDSEESYANLDIWVSPPLYIATTPVMVTSSWLLTSHDVLFYNTCLILIIPIFAPMAMNGCKR